MCITAVSAVMEVSDFRAMERNLFSVRDKLLPPVWHIQTSLSKSPLAESNEVNHCCIVHITSDCRIQWKFIRQAFQLPLITLLSACTVN